MLATDYLNANPELKECYEIHSHFYKDWTIGDFKHFANLEDAKAEGRKRLENNKEVRTVEIKRFYRENGHIYCDGTTKWLLKRI